MPNPIAPKPTSPPKQSAPDYSISNALSKLFLSHRSIRAYKPDEIPQDTIQTVCDEAIAGGSSSGNLNSVSMVLTRDPERKKYLWELHSRQDFILQAPLVITFCADWYRTRQWLASRGARDNFNNLVGYHVAAYDAMILAQNVCLGFESRGYGICYMGTTLFELEPIADFLELPDTVLPVTTITVGVPDENPAKRDRLPTAAYLHDETYRKPDEAAITNIYRDREVKGWNRYMSIPELKALAEEHNITTLAQFYTSKVKYDPDEFKIFSERILAAMKARSFFP